MYCIGIIRYVVCFACNAKVAKGALWAVLVAWPGKAGLYPLQMIVFHCVNRSGRSWLSWLHWTNRCMQCCRPHAMICVLCSAVGFMQ